MRMNALDVRRQWGLQSAPSNACICATVLAPRTRESIDWKISATRNHYNPYTKRLI